MLVYRVKVVLFYIMELASIQLPALQGLFLKTSNTLYLQTLYIHPQLILEVNALHVLLLVRLALIKKVVKVAFKGIYWLIVLVSWSVEQDTSPQTLPILHAKNALSSAYHAEQIVQHALLAMKDFSYSIKTVWLIVQ